jgi:hypothetical protein
MSEISFSIRAALGLLIFSSDAFYQVRRLVHAHPLLKATTIRLPDISFLHLGG